MEILDLGVGRGAKEIRQEAAHRHDAHWLPADENLEAQAVALPDVQQTRQRLRQQQPSVFYRERTAPIVDYTAQFVIARRRDERDLPLAVGVP